MTATIEAATRPEISRSAPATAQTPTQEKPATQRLVSLDAFRGFVMLLMISAGLGIHGMVEGWGRNPELRHLKTPAWEFLAKHTDHAEWAGVTFWDMIQPWFMFMVGVALAFSIGNRQAKGHSFWRMFAHAAWRAVALVILSIFLISYGRHTEWLFTNVLAQIGLGYLFLFLVAWLKPRWQLVTAIAVLFGYWLAFAAYPKPPADYLTQYDFTPGWQRPEGFESHWEKHTNFAARFDQWFLNKFPRYDRKTDKPIEYKFTGGGYQTLNFVPSIATMIFGLLAGQWIRARKSASVTVGVMLGVGAAGVLIGLGIEWLGLCPIIKRIWTPSWAIYAAGWSFIALAIFYLIIDVAGLKAWSMPLVVVGMNSIAAYCLSMLMKPWVRETMQRHFGANIYSKFDPYAPMVEYGLFLLFCWVICWWMYRRKVFLRI